jgi:hypothetical protein
MLVQLFAILTAAVNLFSTSIGTLANMTLGILKVYGDQIICIDNVLSKARTGELWFVSLSPPPTGNASFH